MAAIVGTVEGSLMRFTEKLQQKLQLSAACFQDPFNVYIHLSKGIGKIVV